MMRSWYLILVVFALLTGPARAAAPTKTHHVAFQVDVSDPAVMNMALNNIGNMYDYYTERGEPIDIELVAFGPGFTMLRDDISPVKERLTAVHTAHPTLVFSACENSRRAASKAEGKDIKIVAEAGSVPAGVVRLSELQEIGYTYLRP
jgi:intracellular sulfur oxidation DsrE/DsrF family protein